VFIRDRGVGAAVITAEEFAGAHVESTRAVGGAVIQQYGQWCTTA
jgi:hypothetical protein